MGLKTKRKKCFGGFEDNDFAVSHAHYHRIHFPSLIHSPPIPHPSIFHLHTHSFLYTHLFITPMRTTIFFKTYKPVSLSTPHIRFLNTHQTHFPHPCMAMHGHSPTFINHMPITQNRPRTDPLLLYWITICICLLLTHPYYFAREPSQKINSSELREL